MRLKQKYTISARGSCRNEISPENHHGVNMEVSLLKDR